MLQVNERSPTVLLKINFKSDVPIYMQLRNQIIVGIARGDLVEDEALPSVRQLAADIGVNLHTINKSYNLLKSEGYITVDRRRGATVLPIKRQVSSDFKLALIEDMTTTIASSICNGMDKNDFIKMCSDIFDDIEEVDQHE